MSEWNEAIQKMQAASAPAASAKEKARKALGRRPCDCVRCDSGNIGDAQAVAVWDERAAALSATGGEAEPVAWQWLCKSVLGYPNRWVLCEGADDATSKADAGIEVRPLYASQPSAPAGVNHVDAVEAGNGWWSVRINGHEISKWPNEGSSGEVVARIRSSLQPDTQTAAASAPEGDMELASASVRPEPSGVELLRRCLDVLEGLAKDVDACAHLNDDFSQTSICTEIRRHLAKPPAGGVFQRLYDSEINFSVSTFWDGGFDAKLGDELNGFNAEANVRTMLEAEAWLERQAAELYPASTFATSHSSGQNLADANSIASAPAQEGRADG